MAFVAVSLEDMETFLKRGFRALRPKQGVQNHEYFYDLRLSDHVFIRVWTSVKTESGMGAGVGQDAIRVQLVGKPVNRPLMKGKAPIVKRTNSWKNSLQGKIEEAIETYEERQEYWEARAKGENAPPPTRPPVHEVFEEDDPTPAPSPPSRPPAGPIGTPATEAQVKYLAVLIKRGGSKARSVLISFNLPPDLTEADIPKYVSKTNASRLIDTLKQALGWGGGGGGGGYGGYRRYADWEEDAPFYSYDRSDGVE